MPRRNLKPEQVIDIRHYLAAHRAMPTMRRKIMAHRWHGAHLAIAKKHNVSVGVISSIASGRTYKNLIPARPKNKRICAVCIKPILKNHKWEINDHSQCVHKTCEYPEFRSATEALQPRTLAPTPLFDALESAGA